MCLHFEGEAEKKKHKCAWYDFFLKKIMIR